MAKKLILTKFLSAAAFCGALAASALGAQNLSLGPGSRLWLEGDSTLHPFSSTATIIKASGAAAEAASPAELLKAPGLSFELRVPVESLKSGKSGLDQNMYKALKAKEHPEIIFKLGAPSAELLADGTYLVKAPGALTVAGQEKSVTLEAAADVVDGVLRLRGSQLVLMTDFGIKPPAMMLGAVKTKNEITVRYEIFVMAGTDITKGENNHE
jgi:hypothetical protein